MKRPLLFLHGVTRRGASVLPIEGALATRFDVHAPDFPGHGAAERRPGRYLVVDQVAVARERLLELPGKAVIYGHSMGAMVAAALAAECPERAEAVILEDPPFETMGSRIRDTPLHGYFAALREFAVAHRGAPVHEIARALADLRWGSPGEFRFGDTRDEAACRFSAASLARLDPEVLDPVVEGHWLDGYDQAAIFTRIACPVLLLQADPRCGGMLTDEDVAHAKRAMRDCAHVFVPGGPHLLHWMATQDTLRAVLNFLSAI
ncbi:MAG: alpha/beta hydrolase [Bryobacteraceae bacterium]